MPHFRWLNAMVQNASQNQAGFKHRLVLNSSNHYTLRAPSEHLILICSFCFCLRGKKRAKKTPHDTKILSPGTDSMAALAFP